jgi:hypothetical protein
LSDAEMSKKDNKKGKKDVSWSTCIHTNMCMHTHIHMYINTYTHTYKYTFHEDTS